jgi:alkanesulfonate monooxygenase
VPVEFIGIARTADRSETVTEVGPPVQPDYLYRLAAAHERSGFDRVLVARGSPDGFIVADQVLSATTRLGVLLAHRPGLIAPTLAARRLATIDAFHPGRIALHVSTGGDVAGQARDGDLTGRAARYRRTDEFLQVVTREWRSATPFDHDGEFYRVAGAWSALRPAAGRLPVYVGGASADAVRVGGRHADVYALGGEPAAGVRDRIRRVRTEAAAAGRSIDRFSVSLRPIAAGTEAAAWRRARQLRELASDQAAGDEAAGDQAAGGTRLLRTALIGSYEQVARSLLGYVSAGVTTLLIHGYEPLADAVAYAAIIRLVHERAGHDLGAYRARAAA